MDLGSTIPLSSSTFDSLGRDAAMRANSPREMEQVAVQFESVFMSLLVKEMRETTEDGFFAGEGSDTLGGLFDLYMGQHLADAGGIGLKKVLLERYAQQQGQGTASSEEPDVADAATISSLHSGRETSWQRSI